MKLMIDANIILAAFIKAGFCLEAGTIMQSWGKMIARLYI